jgi:hypothetical protein
MTDDKENTGVSFHINTEEDIFSASEEFKEDAHFSSFSQYKNVYEFSVADKERFWSGEARELHWFSLWKEVKQGKSIQFKMVCRRQN